MEKTIVIVDDSESIREVVGFTLTNAGHKVLAAVDGKDALKFFDGSKVDLVVTDLHMPQMDGIELIKELRSRDDGYWFCIGKRKSGLEVKTILVLFGNGFEPKD
jgi:two-component system, chemotaxis family, chemotaxis protein CheY